MKKAFPFILCVLLAAAGATIVSAQSAKTTGSEVYSWHAELVSLDPAAKTVTVKTMAVGNALDELNHFKKGDRVLLGWSGFDKSANAVNHVVKYESAPKADDRFTFPAEFVGFDSPNRYVTFKAAVPAESIDKLESIKTGQWITATSPQGARSEKEPIVAVKGYNDPDGKS